jgi:regulator of replication initiation timing
MSDSFATENERLLDVIVSFGAENNRLKAENERLKEALKKIDDLTFMPRHKDEALDRAWHITRAALIHTNAPDMDDGRKTEINGENVK